MRRTHGASLDQLEGVLIWGESASLWMKLMANLHCETKLLASKLHVHAEGQLHVQVQVHDLLIMYITPRSC